MAPPDETPPGSTGPPDRQTLQLLERHLASDPLVVETRFEPDTYEPRLLRADIDDTQYPQSVDSARLEIRWFESGDFSLHYVEAHADGGRWGCRWDRHPNAHDARTHFHQPPTVATVTTLSFPSCHPLDVYSTVLDALERRIETLWSD